MNALVKVTLTPDVLMTALWSLPAEDLKVYLTLTLLADENRQWNGDPTMLARILGMTHERYEGPESGSITEAERGVRNLTKKGYLEVQGDGVILVKDPDVAVRRTKKQVANAIRVQRHRSKVKAK